jgi:Molybdopterin cofactor-binding domain
MVCAVDCGVPVNPDVIRAQMEGGIGFGLGAVLHDEITLDGGVVQQSNFHDYVPLRINEMPNVKVHIVPSETDPTGVGEPGVPPVGPALANAVYRLTKQRIRSLPLSKHGLTSVWSEMVTRYDAARDRDEPRALYFMHISPLFRFRPDDKTNGIRHNSKIERKQEAIIARDQLISTALVNSSSSLPETASSITGQLQHHGR